MVAHPSKSLSTLQLLRGALREMETAAGDFVKRRQSRVGRLALHRILNAAKTVFSAFIKKLLGG